MLAGMVILRGLFVHKVRRKSQNWLFMPSAQLWPSASSESEVLVLYVWTIYPVNWPARVGEVKLIASLALFWQVKKSVRVTIPIPSAAGTRFPCVSEHLQLKPHQATLSFSCAVWVSMCLWGIWVWEKSGPLKVFMWRTWSQCLWEREGLTLCGPCTLPAWVSLGSCWDPLSWLSLKEEERLGLWPCNQV